MRTPAPDHVPETRGLRAAVLDVLQMEPTPFQGTMTEFTPGAGR